MDISEVIAIAKTLKPDYRQISVGDPDLYGDNYRIEYGKYGPTFYYGNSWEEVLRKAGWKGCFMPKAKCLKCGKANGPNVPVNYDYARWLCDKCISKYYESFKRAVKEERVRRK